MEKKFIYAGSIMLAAFLWALEGAVLIPRLYNLDTGFVVLMIHLFGFLILNFFLFKEYKKLPTFNRTDYLFLGLIALFGGAIGTLAIVKALFLTNFQHLSVVILLQKLQPVFAIILAMVILKEKASKKFWFWATLAVLASYPLTFGFKAPDFGTGLNYIYAALFSLLAAFAFGSGTVFGRKMAERQDFQTVTFYRYGFTTLLMLIYVFVTGKFQFGVATTLNWWILVLIPLTTGLGGMLLYYYGLRKVSAMTSTICELMFPLSAIFLDYFINKSVLSPAQFFGAAVMVIAIIMITLGQREPQREIPREL